MPTEMPTTLSSSDSEVTKDCSEILYNPRIEHNRMHENLCTCTRQTRSLLIPTQLSAPRRIFAASKLVLVARHLPTAIIFGPDHCTEHDHLNSHHYHQTCSPIDHWISELPEKSRMPSYTMILKIGHSSPASMPRNLCPNPTY